MIRRYTIDDVCRVTVKGIYDKNGTGMGFCEDVDAREAGKVSTLGVEIVEGTRFGGSGREESMNQKITQN